MVQAMIFADQNSFFYNALTVKMLVPPDKSMFTLYTWIAIIFVHAWMGWYRK